MTTFNESRFASLPQYHVSHACNHCERAPCLANCPARAITRDEATGAVLIDSERCIGCRYCSWNCPYDAPLFDAAAGVMTKCTFCHDRQAAGELPACVATCPTGALRVGDPAEFDGVEQIDAYPQRDVGAALRFAPLRADESPRTNLAPPDAPPTLPPGLDAATEAGDGLRDERPLLFFTATSVALVAWFVAHLLGAVAIQPALFLALAVVAMAVSAAHLGRPPRAWMATRGPRRSWLSREILLYPLFIAFAALHFLELAPALRPDLIAAALGYATLFAIDRVYDCVIPRRPIPLHSADTLLTALFLLAILTGSNGLLVPLAAVKLALYLRRPRFRRGLGELRLALGFLAPATVWMIGFGHPMLFALTLVAIGELIDRAEFYLDFEVPTPRRHMRRHLARRLEEA